MSEPAERALTPEQGAELMQLPLSTFIQLCAEGKIPGRCIGRAWRFLRTDLVRFVHGDRAA